MVLFRFGGTGVWNAVQAAARLCDPVVVYPVRSLANFGTADDGSAPFANALLVKRGTKPRDVAYKLNDAIGRHFVHAEAEDGRRLADDEPVKDGAVLRLVTGSAVTDPAVLEREKEREKERLRGAKAVSTTKTKAQRREEQERDAGGGGGGDA